jgi:hypothetical protein
MKMLGLLLHGFDVGSGGAAQVPLQIGTRDIAVSCSALIFTRILSGSKQSNLFVANRI